VTPRASEPPEDPDDRTSAGFVDWLDALTRVNTEDDLFALLADQRPPASKLARQQIRGRLVRLLAEKLKELDSGVSVAKTADASLQEGGEDGDVLQGRAFVAEETVPWGTAVAGTAVLDETADSSTRTCTRPRRRRTRSPSGRRSRTSSTASGSRRCSTSLPRRNAAASRARSSCCATSAAQRC
jgi:hypothetical protein